MIFKRFAANLRAQNWGAIAIEFAIVVAGVFVGTWVANLNQTRIEATETRQMLRSLTGELQTNVSAFRRVIDYYATTRRYAATAFAGWRKDSGVSDRDFVIAAYQASQNNYTGINGSSWSQAFGSDRLRTISDKQLRRDLGQLMSINYTVIESEIFTDYRRHVRQVIPEDVQEAIRAQCGDRRSPAGINTLPDRCSIDLPDDRFVITARALRDRPQLVGELRWHFAAIASYVDNLVYFKIISLRVLEQIRKTT